MKTHTFQPLTDLRPYAIWDGVVARVVNGERMTLATIDLEPNVQVPEHHHENEQLGLILRGTLVFTIAGESRELGPGDTYAIPSHVPHNVVAGPKGASLVDAFAPIRADWEKLPRRDSFPPEWPA